MARVRDDVQLHYPLPVFFLKITHTDTKFSERKKVGKKIDSKAGLHSKLAIMSMHIAHTE